MQSVMVWGTVYVGGGVAGVGSPNNYIVMAYDTSSGKWAKLPPYRACNFAMTVISNQLAVVGGKEPLRSNKIKMVSVWRPDKKKWTQPYPHMSTSRECCSTVVYKRWLVVAGGEGDGGANVEVLNTDTKRWSAGPPTPTAWSEMWPAIVGDVCYFMGGYIRGSRTDIVYSVSLSALIPQLNSGIRDSQIWKAISGLQLKSSSPLSISGSLLAVGGYKDARAMSAIHLYKPDTGEWVKVGDLPTPRYGCTCVMLTDRELVVAGGLDGELAMLKKMDLVQVGTDHVASVM